MSSYDPFPELEPYCNCSNSDGGRYQGMRNVIDVGNAYPMAMSNSFVIQQTKFSAPNPVKEGYNCCRRGTYDTMVQTWAPQKPYSL